MTISEYSTYPKSGFFRYVGCSTALYTPRTRDKPLDHTRPSPPGAGFAGPRLRRGPDRSRTGAGPDRDRRTGTAGTGPGPGGTQQTPPPPKAAGEPKHHSTALKTIHCKTNPGAPNRTIKKKKNLILYCPGSRDIRDKTIKRHCSEINAGKNKIRDPKSEKKV